MQTNIQKKILLWGIMIFVLIETTMAQGPPNATVSTYDLTNISKADDLFEFVQEVNKITNSYFMVGVLFVSFIILFIAFLNRGTNDAFLASGFITSMITIFFTSLDLVPRAIAILIFVSYGSFFAYRIVKG